MVGIAAFLRSKALYFLGRRPYILPAQGNALGMMNQTIPASAQRVNLSGFVDRFDYGLYD
jgi:hypothetical protein